MSCHDLRCISNIYLNFYLMLYNGSTKYEFHVDFEISAHNVLLNLYPDCKIVACTFHLAQSWFRHIQSNKQLLIEYNNKNSNTGNWLKSFFGLPYLSPEEVDVLYTINFRLPNVSDFSFSDYVLETYIIPDSKFNPTLWQDIRKTNLELRTVQKHFIDILTNNYTLHILTYS
ncbi:Uncharacterized protein FWK35_00025764, partial [Aphis craccivora]